MTSRWRRRTTLARLNPQMTFIYVSGAGTDCTEQGARMWARVKGKTENALLPLPFKAAYMFRPGVIQPLHGDPLEDGLGAGLLRCELAALGGVRRLTPRLVTSTEQIGRGMIRVAREGFPRKVLEMEGYQWPLIHPLVSFADILAPPRVVPHLHRRRKAGECLPSSN